ncbi:MAG: hypothetical protein B6245_01110 [Desulfobacteraceae bacterium 4572_88]|nr:MAG: hypothetical protein B6245_01110 [Desulfobacteraceae bacterium 4572_88]
MLLELAVLGGTIYTGSCLYEKGRKWLWGSDDEKQKIGGAAIFDSLDGGIQTIIREFRGDKAQHDTFSPRADDASGPDTPVVSTDLRTANRNFALALGAFGLTSAGGLLGYPLLALITVPGLIWFVGSFVHTALKQIFRKRRPGMAVIDAIVTSSLLLMGYFWAIALYASFFSFSRKLLISTRESYQEDIGAIIAEIPSYVWIKQGDTEVEIPIASVRSGDIVAVHAGEVIPVDGIVSQGEASVDQHILTGEARPSEKCPGDSVFATTLVLTGTLCIRVEQTGRETAAAKIREILRDTAAFTSMIELQGEAVGDGNVVIMLVLGTVTIPLLGPMKALTVLCSYIGYAMRIIGPLSVLNFLKIASRQHVFVKDGRAMETLAHVDTVIFDKTGTLTLQQPDVGNIHAFAPYTEEEVLRYAAAAEYKQTHPIANAILHEANRRRLDIPPIDDASYEIGHGIRVAIGQSVIDVGSERFMRSQGTDLPPNMRQIRENSSEYTVSFVYVAIDNKVIGTIELRTTVRPETEDIIADLKQRGINVLIVSGDHENPTRQLAHDLGVDEYVAEALPLDKAKMITRLREQGYSVCFVGDGINDSIALKKADVSISLRGASAIATDTAQIILTDKGLNQLPRLFDLAMELDSNMRNNFLISITPGIITVGGVYLLGFGLPAAYILYYAGLTAGITNAMLPLKAVLRKKATSQDTDRRVLLLTNHTRS